jgi:chromosome segregation ATPase
MPEPDALETRVTTLEHEVAHLREEITTTRSDAAAARILAGGADRDVSAFGAKLDAHTKTLNALRETQVEQGEILREHSEKIDRLETRFDGLEREMRHGFATLGTGMAQITALLQGITGPDHQ